MLKERTRVARKLVDLHVHGWGDQRDFDIIDRASNAQISAIAIGKRAGGVMKNYSELTEYANQKGIKLLTLSEFNIKLPWGTRTDLVAIAFDPNHPEIIQWKENAKVWNVSAAIEQIEYLESLGISFNSLDNKQKEDLETIKEGCDPERGGSLSFLAVQSGENIRIVERYLNLDKEKLLTLEKKYEGKTYLKGNVKLAKYLWEICFSAEGVCRFSPQPPTHDIYRFIHTMKKAGGVVLYSPEGKFDIKAWGYLRSKNCDGIMGWHANTLFDEIPLRVAISFLKEKRPILGGSDFDPIKDDWQIGCGKGKMKIDERVLKTLDQYLASNIS